MQHADEGQIHAYLDRQLEFADPERRKELGRHIADCGRCTKLLIEARRLRSGAEEILTTAPVDAVKPPSFQDIVDRAKSLQPMTPPGTVVDDGVGHEAGEPLEADEESGWASDDQPVIPIAESPHDDTAELGETAGASVEDQYVTPSHETDTAADEEEHLGVDADVPRQEPISSGAPTFDRSEVDDQPDADAPDFELSIPTPEVESPAADFDAPMPASEVKRPDTDLDAPIPTSGMESSSTGFDDPRPPTEEEPPPADAEAFESVPDLDFSVEQPTAENLGVPELVSDFDLKQGGPDIELTPQAVFDDLAPAATPSDPSAHVGDMPLIANDFDSQMFPEPQATDAEPSRESGVSGQDGDESTPVDESSDVEPVTPPTTPEFDLVAEMDQLEMPGPMAPPAGESDLPSGQEGDVPGRERLASMPEIELETDSLLSSRQGQSRESVEAAGQSEVGFDQPDTDVAGTITPAKAKKPGGMRWMAIAASVIIVVGAGWIARPWLFRSDAGQSPAALATDSSLVQLAAEPASRGEAEDAPAAARAAPRSEQPSREVPALAVAQAAEGAGAPDTLASPAEARRATSEIAGSIVDSESNRPVVGAQIIVVGTDLATTTGADGRYRIAAVPAGTAQVRARAVGYTTEERAVNLSGGETVGSDFSLRAAAVALDEIVAAPPEQVAARADRAREQPSAAVGTPEPARMTPGEWSVTDRREAEELLNGPLVAVVGLPIETISQAATGQRIVLVEQTLTTGGRLELEIRIGVGNRNLQDTDQALRPTAVLARSVTNGARGTASIGPYTITARAPVSEADLTALLGRLAEASRSD